MSIILSALEVKLVGKVKAITPSAILAKPLNTKPLEVTSYCQQANGLIAPAVEVIPFEAAAFFDFPI